MNSLSCDMMFLLKMIIISQYLKIFENVALGKQFLRLKHFANRIGVKITQDSSYTVSLSIYNLTVDSVFSSNLIAQYSTFLLTGRQLLVNWVTSSYTVKQCYSLLFGFILLCSHYFVIHSSVSLLSNHNFSSIS